MNDIKSGMMLIDTETGGLDSIVHSLLTIGVLSRTVEKEWKIKRPAYTVSPSALRVNGLDLEDLGKNGQEPQEVLEEFSESLMSHSVYIGHNLQFDAGFIRDGLPGGARLYSHIMRNHIDTKALALNAQIQGKIPTTQSTSLHPLGEYFGIDASLWANEFHASLVDARLTYEVYLKLNTL